MGSLMAGWDSPSSDPKLVKYKRNQSLTKEEIEAFWRAKKKNEEEHLKAVSSPSSDTRRRGGSQINDCEMKFQRSSSLPITNTKTGSVDCQDEETSLEKFIKQHGWWTRSTSAFLNEPPVLEGMTNTKTQTKTYAAQFHVPNLA